MLTDEQIENWRSILYLDLGSYARIMPREDIEKLVKKLQTMINKESETIDGKSAKNDDM